MSSDCDATFFSVTPLLVITIGITSCFSATEILQSTNSYLTTADRVHLKKILEPGLTSNDLALTYYAVHGYTFLKEVLPNKQVRNTILMKKFYIELKYI